MEKLWRLCFLKLIIMFVLMVRLNAVTVNPALCPTNKIAPHKRTARWDSSRPRTIGTFYNLFAPTGLPGDSLVEKPQEDAPNDCGEIDDYDENDLSSITPQSQRRRANNDNRFLGVLFPFWNHGNHHSTTTRPPPPATFQPVRPTYLPVRPPYASGGVFSDNFYRPPLAHHPSGHIKPVHDGVQESQLTYRPGLVGAPSGAVIGATQVITVVTSTESNQKMPSHDSIYFPPHIKKTSPSNNIRSRPKKLNDGSIIGSFISLLFK